MIHVYIEDKLDFFSLPREESLPALESQVLEIFEEFNFMEKSVLGLIIDNKTEVQIKSFNKYIWKIDIVPLDQNLLHYRRLYYSKLKVIQLIKDIFLGKKII